MVGAGWVRSDGVVVVGRQGGEEYVLFQKDGEHSCGGFTIGAMRLGRVREVSVTRPGRDA